MTSRIKIIQSLAGAAFGGAENFYTRLVCSLEQNPSFKQIAFTRSNAEREQRLQQAGVTVRKFRFGGKLDVLDQLAYRRALKQETPDVVLAYMNRASGMTPAGNYQLVCRLGHFYNLKYYRHANYWIGNTTSICDYLIKGGMPAARVVHLPNFSDEVDAQPLQRTSFNTPKDAPLLLAAGRLHTNKAFDTLLRALVNVPDAILWLAGEGPERETLQALSVELGVNERVRFLGWRSDIPSLMRTTDLFVCPSRHEGLGGIVLEAWLNQCPIVSTLSQGPSELIEDGHSGLLTPIDHVEALSNAISHLLLQPEQARVIAANGLTRYQQSYSQAVITQQYADFLQSIARR